MKKIVFTLILILLSTPSFADYYVFEKPGNDIAELDYRGKYKNINEVIKDSGLSGYTIHKVKKSDLPKEPAEFWIWENGRVEFSKAKKDAKEAEKEAKKNKQKQVLNKIGIDEEEWKELTDKEVNPSLSNG